MCVCVYVQCTGLWCLQNTIAQQKYFAYWSQTAMQQPCTQSVSVLLVCCVCTNINYINLFRVSMLSLSTCSVHCIYNDKLTHTHHDGQHSLLCSSSCAYYDVTKSMNLVKAIRDVAWHKRILLLKLALTALLWIASFNGPSCTGYSSSRAGACRHTAIAFCVPVSNCFAEKMARDRAMFNMPHSAILWRLFTKGFCLS